MNACDVWAVGYDTASHWDGSSWQSVTMGSNLYMNAAWAADSSHVFAVGATIYEWTGSSWDYMGYGVPSGVELYSVHGFSPTDVYAAGYFGSTGGEVLLHFDGSTWTQVSVPNSSGFGLFTLWGTSGFDLWTVDDNQVWHFNGSSWTAYQPGTNTYDQIWGASSSDVWVVERTGGSSNTMWHWNGSSWSSHTTPLAGQIVSLTGSSSSDIWAVDNTGNVAQYCGASWASRGATGTEGGLVVPTAGAVWGIGSYAPSGSSLQGLIVQLQ